MKKYILVFVALLFVTSGLFAQSNRTPHLKKRQINQSKRIAQGAKSGSLTKWETTKLVGQEIKLQKHKKQAKADGVVTPRERVKLNREANRLNRRIYKQKHDKQKRK